MSSDKDVLLSMGFDPARVDWAVKATGGRGLQPAMDFLLENDGKPVPDLASVSAASASSGGGAPMDVDDEDREELEALQAVYGKAQVAPAGGESVEAQSIKCSQCGKVFKNTALANYHAEKSGHDQFEESTEEVKPLTEEEKTQRLADLKEKMAAKRAVKAKEEAKEHLANENIRRKAGRDMNEIREELKAKELKKDLEAKKREKIEEAQARARVKAQIEADKRERAEKAAREKALREGKPVPGSSAAPAPAAPAAAPAPKTSGKDYPETRLQIRMASGGQPYTTTLPSDSTLREVAEFLAAQTLSVDAETVTFAMHFPRKQFTRSDLSKSLRDLGLTPSAVLIAS
ncbi:ubiquitin-related domain-containing protein [Rhodofomes roseus]|uniref:Ubiquitin-related domain-containing protein n=1 Tax=Rhodofomes roseus TaxID=34475 RepID=A0ABQ8K6D4_9APHY|nr:ubiquitin-related domain-containing protein [Rhodofomes roseus]KAH9832658.1 ubiquitin-related domain-containing protein [Rhodofomes roseus]